MAKKKYTCITTVVSNHVYYNPGDTVEFDETEGDGLIAAGVLEELNPERKETAEETRKPQAPFTQDLTEIKGVGRETASMINNMGIRNYTGLAGADVLAIAEIPSLSERKAKDIIKQAARLAKKFKK